MKLFQNTTKYILLSACFILTSFLLTGCSFSLDKPIFETETDPYELVPYTKSELSNDIFYVKNGTKFYKAFPVPSKNTSETQTVCWLGDNERAVPVYYKNEFITYSTSEKDYPTYEIIRYKDMGFSVCSIGMYYANDGFCFSGNSAIGPATDISKILSNENAKEFRITAIDGTAVKPEDLSECGTILNMNKDQEYEISYYAGTYLKTAPVKADSRILMAFETYEIKEYEDTQNGYAAVRLPEDALSGYYSINGYMFKYYNFEKGEKNESEQNMNISYFDISEETILDNSQQYSFSLDTEKRNMKVTIPYDQYDQGDPENNIRISAYLFAPDGTQYDMQIDEEKQQITCMLDEALGGKWIINIIPRDLPIKKIDVQSDDLQQESTEQEYSFYFEENASTIKFFINYEGHGDVHGIIIMPDGTTYDFNQNNSGYNNSSSGELTYSMAYVPKGEYIIKVYHYTDTDITEVSYTLDTGNETDTITVTD